jgi:hypothetical protein
MGSKIARRARADVGITGRRRVSGTPEFLLVGAVALVGVLHTLVPDHWVPITLIARQQGWSRAETARAALLASTGHVLSTLLIASVVWLAGMAVASRFGHVVDTISSVALILFGGWFALSSLREMKRAGGHAHGHNHHHGHGHARDLVHGPEMQEIETGRGTLRLSIFETGVPPRFRLSGPKANAVAVVTERADSTEQHFSFVNRGRFWESVDVIPEPHEFSVSVSLVHDGAITSFRGAFTEYKHGEHDHPHHAAHAHLHRHGEGPPHEHEHEHEAGSAHRITEELAVNPPVHEHRHKKTARTLLLLILGSSPMVEGIPAFFAAAKYGIGLIIVMAITFALATIATYVALCVSSTAGLQSIRLGRFERYGEVLSGAFIALVGLAFWIWPVL